jgi:hypothetical protein
VTSTKTAAIMIGVRVSIGVVVGAGVFAHRFGPGSRLRHGPRPGRRRRVRHGWIYTRTLARHMRTYSVTSGHTALILTKPGNDMALEDQAVLRLVERLEPIEKLSKHNVAYQTAPRRHERNRSRNAASSR